MTHAHALGKVHLPWEELTNEAKLRIRQYLTVTPKNLDKDAPDPLPVENYEVVGNTCIVPLSFGLAYCKKHGIPLQDDRCEGAHIGKALRLPNPKHPKAPKEQDVFINDILAKLREHGTALGFADTGLGKTVCLLYAIGVLERAALVIVPSKALARLWVREAKEHIGLEEKEIGVLVGSKVAWRGKKLVVAVVHNLIQKQWDDEFYEYFGFVAWDEVHKVSAPYFAPTLGMFPAKYQIAVTATPNRKDKMDILFRHHLGVTDESVAEAKAKALPCQLEIVVWDKQYIPKWKTHKQQRAYLITKISEDDDRTRWLLQFLLGWGYDDGRNCLAVSDRKEHLRKCREILIENGVPDKDIGLYIGNVPQAKLEEIENSCKIILATYQMIKEGVNIPRLDFGMDLTPRADATQLIGRIRRPCFDKKLPLWVTCVDVQTPILKSMLYGRIKDYRACGVEMLNLHEIQL